MKKLLAVLAISGFFVACSNSSDKSGSATGDSAATGTTMSAPKSDSSTSTAPTTTTASVKDSVMQFKDGKVMISVGGSWTALSAPVTTTNGRTVNPNGDVSKGGKTRKLEEGMMIDKDGQMMDKDGKMMDNTGWE